MARLSSLEMKVTHLSWMGARTEQFDRMNEFYRDVLDLEVDDFAAVQSRLLAAGVEFIYPEPQRSAGKAWQHFRAPDGNVYELIGDDVST